MATQKEKIERALYGPGWGEVTLGAAMSIILGIILAVVLLVLKPAQLVNEMPKEPEKGVVYFVQGTKDANRARTAPAKRAQFIQGTGVMVNEDEMNTILASASPVPPPAPVAPKAGDKKDAPPAPATAAGILRPSNPNFRVVDGKLQIAVPCTLSALGFNVPIAVVATGTFEKSGDQVVFVPDDLHLGSLAAGRIPGVAGFVRGKLMAAEKVPDDIAAAWKKVSGVTIEGKNLTIAM